MVKAKSLPESMRHMPDLAPPTLDAQFLEPQGFQWGVFVNDRGQALRWGHLPVANATRACVPRACVIVGGFGEFVEKYFETIADFAARGFSVWCLDWSGQGASARPDGDPTRPLARDFTADADDLARFAETVVTGKRKLLVAHSMGGAIGLLSLSRHPKVFDAAVLSAPMLGLQLGGLPRPVAAAIVWVAMTLGKADAFAPGAGRWASDSKLCPARSHLSNDEHRCLVQREWYGAHPGLQVDGATYGWLRTALDVMARLRDPALLAKVTLPVLMGSAGRDILVSPPQHEITARLLPDAELVRFPAAKHELFMETDAVRKPWLAAIDAFVARHLPA
jgi:lysophospholipase